VEKVRRPTFWPPSGKSQDGKSQDTHFLASGKSQDTHFLASEKLQEKKSGPPLFSGKSQDAHFLASEKLQKDKKEALGTHFLFAEKL